MRLLRPGGVTTAVAVALALGAAASSSGCTVSVGRHRNQATDCRNATMTAEPGRVVTVDGAQQLELRGRVAERSKPVARATVHVLFNHRKPDGSLAVRAVQTKTDAQGGIVYRQALDSLAADIAAHGPLASTYQMEWRYPPPLNGEQLCSWARANASLPVDQLPSR